MHSNRYLIEVVVDLCQILPMSLPDGSQPVVADVEMGLPEEEGVDEMDDDTFFELYDGETDTEIDDDEPGSSFENPIDLTGDDDDTAPV